MGLSLPNPLPLRRGGAPPPAPFVVGSPRSGTTMLRLMLDAHPRLAIPPETWFLPGLLEARRTGGRLTPERAIAIMTAERRWGDFGIDADELRSLFAGSAHVSPRRAARSFYRLYARRQGKRRWGDKTPEYVSHMAAISRALPEARFIHLIRDGRAVFLSRAARREARPRREAGLWSRLIARARRQGARIEHYMEVRYEDLVRDPEPQLRAICRFAGLRFKPAMLHYHERAEQRLGEIYRDLPGESALTADERRRLHRNSVRPPDPGLIDRWRDELSHEQIAEYEAKAGATLASLGYELLTDPAAARDGRRAA